MRTIVHASLLARVVARHRAPTGWIERAIDDRR